MHASTYLAITWTFKRSMQQPPYFFVLYFLDYIYDNLEYKEQCDDICCHLNILCLSSKNLDDDIGKNTEHDTIGN